MERGKGVTCIRIVERWKKVCWAVFVWMVRDNLPITTYLIVKGGLDVVSLSEFEQLDRSVLWLLCPFTRHPGKNRRLKRVNINVDFGISSHPEPLSS